MKHSFFYLQKKGRVDWVNYLMTFMLVVVGYFVGQIPLTGVVLFKMTADDSIGMDTIEEFQKSIDFSLVGISSNFGLILMLLSFLGSLFFLWVGVKYIHKIPFRYLITTKRNISWKKILTGFTVWFFITLVYEMIIYSLNSEMYEWNFNLDKFIPLLLISLTLLFIQTSTEELLMRGYLMPAIGFLAKNKWIPLIITSVVFASLHGMNPEVEKFGLGTMAVYYISAGLFLGIITIMDDSLELALVVHWATNLFASTFATFEGSALQTDAIFKIKEMNPGNLPIGFIITASIFYIICSRIYKWRGISYLFEKLN